jgi:hypothetical protein
MRECRLAYQFPIPRTVKELVFILSLAQDLSSVFSRRVTRASHA